MKRKTVLIPLVILTVIALAGVASAAFNARLKGRGTLSGIAFAWDQTVGGGTNDAGVLNDPVSGPTGAGSGPAREVYNVGSTERTFDPDGTLVLTTTDAYSGYNWSFVGFGRKLGAGQGVFVIQGVNLQNAGGEPFTPGTELKAQIKPDLCGAIVPADDPGTTPQEGLWVEARVTVGDIVPGANYQYTLDTQIVPQAIYNAAACQAQAWNV